MCFWGEVCLCVWGTWVWVCVKVKDWYHRYCYSLPAGLGWLRLGLLLIGSFKFISMVTVRHPQGGSVTLSEDGYRKQKNIVLREAHIVSLITAQSSVYHVCVCMLCICVTLWHFHFLIPTISNLVSEFGKVHNIPKVWKTLVEFCVFIETSWDVYKVSGIRIVLMKHLFLQSLPL